MEALTDQEVQSLLDSMRYNAVVFMGIMPDILDNLEEFDTVVNMN